MIAYYAVGGGLGHLTRARAVVHTLGLKEELALLSASPPGDDPRITGGARFIRVPTALAADLGVYREWLLEVLEALSPRLLFIDAFPAGLLGEFCDFPFPKGLQVYHVARLLRWPAYQERLWGEAPPFEMTFCVEPLTPDHRRYLRGCSNDLVDLTLDDPPATITPSLSRSLAAQRRADAPLWLVIHAGPRDEVDCLCQMARQRARSEGVRPQLLLVSPRRPMLAMEDLAHVPLYPATTLFPQAQRIITACGFNAMRQAQGPRHLFVPFSRPLDDQHLRAARRVGPS